MNQSDPALASRMDTLQRRVRALSVWLGIAWILALASGVLGAWHAYDAREARKNEAFLKRKIEYLESRLSAHVTRADRQLLMLERHAETARPRLRSGELTAVRRWLTRADRILSEDRARVEALERRLATLEDSVRIAFRR